jgi:hypothetical protein
MERNAPKWKKVFGSQQLFLQILGQGSSGGLLYLCVSVHVCARKSLICAWAG